MNEPSDLLISIPPLLSGNLADYLQRVEIPVSVSNRTPNEIVIERILFRFQSDWSAATSAAISRHDFPDFRLAGDAEDYRKVVVVPSPLFRANTNCFDVCITYRKDSNWSKVHQQVQLGAKYLIIREPPPQFGRMFISYKDPEDRQLAEILAVLCRRTGFQAYVAPADIRPGSDIWEDKIPREITNSRALLAICTERTPFGRGVSREIQIARNAGVRDIGFIQRGTACPSEYDGTSKELVFFDTSNPAPEFSEALVGLRQIATLATSGS
jgi:hypothetical protein